MRGASRSSLALRTRIFLLACATLICGRSPLLRFRWRRTTITAIWGSYLFYLLLQATAVHALDPDKRISQYIHTSWRTQDGSAPAGMYTVAQTSDGFLWFSAFSQWMYRFDGVRFVPLLSPSSGAIHKVFKVLGDHAGGLWAGGTREIVHLKGGVVSSDFELEGLSSFQNMSEDPDGSLWVVRAANTVSDAPLCHITLRAIKCFGKADGIPITPIDSILADGKGGFWLGGQTALVHWHDRVSETYPIEALKSNVGQHGIVSLALGPDASLWVGILAEGPGLGLGQLKQGAVKPFVTPTFDGSKVEVHATMFDRDGNLWIATAGKGIFRIHGNFVDHYGRTDGLSSDSVFDLYEDREGIVWAATADGIDSFRDPRVTTFSASEGLGKDAAVGVLASRDGSIWVANDGSLDHIAKGTISSIRTGRGLPGHQVASLLEDRAGKLWVGVDDGLYLFENGRFRRLPEPNNRPLGIVVALAEDVDGNVWAECASNPRKLVRIRDFQVREEFPASQVPAGRELAPDPQGGIWIGTAKGELALFRHGVLEKFPLNPKGDAVSRRIAANSDGSVLAATEDGLVGLRQGKLQHLTTENGLPCNSVISFVEGKEKRWWLYTDCGILELPDSELQRWWSDPKTVVQARVYDQLDGARPNAPYFNSAAYSQDGRVWFANGTVVQMVDPSRLSQKALPAMTYIESIIVDRKEFAVTDKLNLGPHLRDLQIDYTSPTFTIPQRVKFRYRLDNYDSDWHEAGTRRQAFFTDLPPGKYSFRVLACNSDGVWSESATKLDFSVAPAYYQTNWFRALCVAAFIILLWAAYQLRVRQLAARFSMRLEERVGERTRIARDLHDTLLQSFHGILLHFQTGINLLPERPGEARNALEKAMHQAKRAIVEGREAIQGLRSSVVESNDLALAMRTLGEELAANANSVAFQVNVEGPPRNLHPILRDEVYRITGEAMRNAFRHADAKQIEVEIHYDERQLRVRVRDDGKGIDPKLLSDDGREGHFGLRGMRERAKLIGGKLTVWSELEAGTEVELSITASYAYTAPTEGQPMRLTDKIFAKLFGRGTVKKTPAGT
jgi:signal transduction histidine kinase/ligand-binding sensor domain-containing protein